MSKEAIALLEMAERCIKPPSSFCEKAHGFLIQALDILKQPKCKTCGDKKEILQRPKIEDLGNGMVSWDARPKPCPDCQQPIEGEYTKKVRLSIQSKKAIISKITDINILAALGWIPQLCDRLDSAEARLKVIPDLLEALKQSKEIFSKKLRLVRAKETKTKADFAFIEHRYWSGVYNNMFELRQEIERMLAKLKLNEFCILTAFMSEEKREVAIAEAKKVME